MFDLLVRPKRDLVGASSRRAAAGARGYCGLHSTLIGTPTAVC
jgi:hypothetical protein